MVKKLRPYNDPDYRQAKAWFKSNPTPCHFPGCTQVGTTVDHVPAIMHHTHIRGARCCRLLPACHFHNSSHGATEGNKMREPRSPW